MADLLLKFVQYVAPVLTPRTNTGEINFDVIPHYIDHLISTGVQGILVSGTVGEGILMAVEERLVLAKAFVAAVKGRVAIYVHTGGINLTDSVRLTTEVVKLDVDAVMISAPVYYHYTKLQGLMDYLVTVGKACTSKPILYYHFPDLTQLRSQSIVDIVRGLQESLPNFGGLKFTSNCVEDYEALLKMDTKIFLGYHTMTLTGCKKQLNQASFIMMVNNYWNRLIMAISDCVIEGRLSEAEGLQNELDALNTASVCHGDAVSSFRVVLDLLNVPMGPPVPPLTELNIDEVKEIKSKLERLQFRKWFE